MVLEGSNPDWRRIAVAARENHPTPCSSLGPIYWKGLSCWSHTWYHVLYLSDNIATNHAHIVSLFLSEGSSDLSMIERGLLSPLSSLSRSDLAPICDGILKFGDQSHVVVKMLSLWHDLQLVTTWGLSWLLTGKILRTTGIGLLIFQSPVPSYYDRVLTASPMSTNSHFEGYKTHSSVVYWGL